MHRHPPKHDAALPEIPLHIHEMIAEQFDRDLAAHRRRRSWRRRPSVRTTAFRPARRPQVQP